MFRIFFPDTPSQLEQTLFKIIVMSSEFRVRSKKYFNTPNDEPTPDLETETFFSVSHCEHLEGAWQSHGKRQDCFGSLAMTISKSEFGYELITPN